MDYKYIEQLLERYWACQTTLEEEEILRAFFCQAEVPTHLQPYRPLFVYEHEAGKQEVLSDDFDRKVLERIGEVPAEKARVVTLRQRLLPLFRAAAVVAIILTLGNAMQVAFDNDPVSPVSVAPKTSEGPSVAAVKPDSAKVEAQRTATMLPQQETFGLQP